ncbi:MAG: glycosyltransferase family 4 protein [Erythrobacter sp.]
MMRKKLKIFPLPILAGWYYVFHRSGMKVPANATLPARALQIWTERRDLQAAFNLTTINGRIGLFWWCLLHGFREMGLRYNEELDSDFGVVNQPLQRFQQESFTPVTWLMHALWTRANCHKSDLRKKEEQYNCIAHYFAHGLLEANLGSFLTQEQAVLLCQSDQDNGVPRICGLIWHCSADVKERFKSPISEEFVAWCRSSEAAQAWPILAHPLVKIAQSAPRKLRRGKVRGVNLFGHALGRFGIGEDVRMAAKALDAAGIPYVIRNVTAPAVGEEDGSVGLRLANDLPYDVNLFCMTGISTAAVALAEGKNLSEARYNIGVWHWELPEWPAAFDHAWDFVDEVWAPSRFTYDSYARAARVPVLHMPVAVMADTTERATRANFGLPKDSFLFGFAFDGLSSFARKNPQAVIEAFQQAFSKDEAGVGLVLKGIRADANTPALNALHEQIGEDPRIHIINDSFSRGRLLDLYRALDTFVSLHRSEGFGRNIAEAMLLKKPVIVSAHSGNMDFTEFQSAALVPTRLCTVREGEYPFGAGQMWGDPDVVFAAQAMRRMVADPEWRNLLALRGHEIIKNRFSSEAVGRSWAQRFQELA